MQLLCVPPARAHELWPLARRHVHGAMDRVGLQTAHEVEYDVLTGHALLWLLIEDDEVRGAVVTAIVRAGTARILEIVACGAEVAAARAHFRLIARIEDHARSAGCTAVRIIGRRGWSRALRGYHTKALILEKAL